MGKMLSKQIPWTKSLYDSFLEDAILTEMEKKIAYCRIWEKDKWTIDGLALRFNTSRSTINNCISSYRRKYDYLHYTNPDKYPKRVRTHLEKEEMLGKLKAKSEEIIYK